MSSTPVERNESAAKPSMARGVEMKLEAVVIPVSDVDRAKRFYGKLGWRLDADFVVGDDFRAVQFTPPGSPCSIHFGKGVTQAAPGSAAGLFLVVSDIEAAHADLAARGVDAGEVFHRPVGEPPMSGVDPQRRSYTSYATFADPDGNSWLLQEVTARLPGRVDANDTRFSSSAGVAGALDVPRPRHGKHEKRTGGQYDNNWPDWYASYMVAEQVGQGAAALSKLSSIATVSLDNFASAPARAASRTSGKCIGGRVRSPTTLR